MRNLSLTLAIVLAVVLSACGQQFTAAQIKANDINLLNYALTLEHLEASFYNKFQAQYTDANFQQSNYPAGTWAYFNLIKDHENAHVQALTATIISLGGTPVAACTAYNFDSVVSVQTYVGLAQILENTGVAAYDGAIGTATDKDITTAGATIATVEARHAAFLNNLTAMNPFPNAFDPTNTTAQIVQIITPLLRTCGPLPTLPNVLVQLPVFSSLSFLDNGTFVQNATNFATFISQNDLNVLSYALFLEKLEAAFYTQFLAAFNVAAFNRANFSTGVYNYVALIGAHENSHVSYLQGIVGTTPTCTYNFAVDGALDTVGKYMALANTFENVGVTAYDGAIAAITNAATKQAAATIATVEARHAAYLSYVLGASPFPAATDNAVSPANIAATVGKYISGCPLPTLPVRVLLSPNNATASTTATTASTTSQLTSSTSGRISTTTGTTGSTGTTGASGTTGSPSPNDAVVIRGVSAIMMLLALLALLL